MLKMATEAQKVDFCFILTCASMQLKQTNKFNIHKRKFIVRGFDFIPQGVLKIKEGK